MHLSNKKICIIINAVTVMAICVSAYIVMTPTPQPQHKLSRAEFPIKGIDISAHNGHIDFRNVAEDSIDFVIMKATEGTDFCDASFNINYHAAKGAGLPVGAYHFFRFETPGAVQASHFINTIAGKEFDLPLAIDVERTGNNLDQSITRVKRELHDMVDAVRRAGYPVMIYVNKKDRARFIDGEFDDVPLWICSLSDAPVSPNWIYWQHSHKGHVKGISGPVDINTCNPKKMDGPTSIASFSVSPM